MQELTDQISGVIMLASVLQTVALVAIACTVYLTRKR